MKEYNYRFNCSEYVLHHGDTPVGPLLQEVALAFSKENGVLHKHGALPMVSQWTANVRRKMAEAGFHEMAEDLVVISGRFPLDELNKCLTITGYVGRLYRQLEGGTLQEVPSIPQ